MSEKHHHPTAVIHKATRLGDEVTVGPYAVVEDGVEIGPGCIIREHAVIRSGTVMGPKCVVDSGAVIGGLPQDLAFDPRTPSGVRVGRGVTFREGVTINRSTREGAFTEIGDHSFFMANAHVGHDCEVGEHTIVANGVLLAGFVTVGGYGFIGGGAAIHQFCRIGESAMIGGLGRISQDLPPFCMMSERNRLVGLNLVGLRRRGFDKEDIRELKRLFHLVFGSEGRPRVLARATLDDGLAATASGRAFLEFIATESRKGVMRPDRGEDR